MNVVERHAVLLSGYISSRHLEPASLAFACPTFQVTRPFVVVMASMNSLRTSWMK